MQKRKMFYVLSTHWDREWYQVFQDFRYRLVDLLDDVLDGIASGQLKGPFYADGQSCLLEDYLEVRTGKSGQISDHLASGKIVAGPWYVLPDEFLISGESFIRNIRLGFDTVRNMGAEPSKAGFLCDMFGHISQVPQMFNLFGIKACFVWRGLNPETANLIWQGADGTKLPAYAFGNGGYGGFGIDVRNTEGVQYQQFAPKSFRERLKKYIEQEMERNDIDPILIFDGLDHQCWDRQAYTELFDFISDNEDMDLEHVDLDHYMEEMLKEKDKITYTLNGELREVAKKENRHLIMGVISSRVDIKQENAYCENLLCSWAEPFGVFSNILTGQDYPCDFLKVAWKWLIKNHPHDSICGCSIDQVHRDMAFRFSQAKQIGERLTEESLKRIAIDVDVEIQDNSFKVVLFNSSPNDREEVIELDLDIPNDWPAFIEFFGFEKLPAFRIFDTDGNEIEYQRLSQQLDVTKKVIFRTNMPAVSSVTKVRVAVKLSIPPMGYKTVIVKKAQENETVRHSSQEKIANCGNCLENEYLKVTVNPNGTVSMCDKQSGQSYDNLLRFEDNSDIGDGWFHGIAVNDIIVNSLASPAQVSIISNGPELATIEIKNLLRLPEEFSFSTMKRSDRFTEFVVVNFVTLRKGSRKLEIETRINNNVKDHRLRVCFRTDADTETFLTDSLFDVVERNVKLDSDNYKYLEIDVDTRPQQTWTALCDGKRGLAVMSTGLYESAVSDDESKDIKLTLFRSTRKTVMTSGEPDGQLLKPLTFKYSVMPTSGQIDRIELFKQAHRLANPPRAIQLSKSYLDIVNSAGKLPPTAGFLNIEGAVMTSVSRFKEHTEIRLFNPLDIDADAKVTLASKDILADFSRACQVDFDGNKLGSEISFNEGEISLPIKPKQIITLCIS